MHIIYKHNPVSLNCVLSAARGKFLSRLYSLLPESSGSRELCLPLQRMLGLRVKGLKWPVQKIGQNQKHLFVSYEEL